MATTRPLMQLGIGDLEDIFEKQSKNLATLGRLKHELSHRQVPRAIALLERVVKAEALLADLEDQRPDPKSPRSTLQIKPHSPSPDTSPAPVAASPSAATAPRLQVPTEQPDLLFHLPAQKTPAVSVPLPVPEQQKPTTITATETVPVKRPAPVEPEPLPQLALEDACRILKVGAGDAWEKVETARRKLVTKSSPAATSGLTAAQVQKLLAEARMANDAAIVIAARRSGRQ